VVETYRPEYQTVSTVNDVAASNTFAARVRGLVIRSLPVTPALYVAFKVYRGDWALSMATLKNLIHLVEQSAQNTNGNFWFGFGVSSFFGASTTIGALSHINKLLNTNTNFKSFPPTKKFSAFPVRPKKTAASGPVLDPRVYRTLPLVKKDKLSHDSHRFVFALPNKTDSVGIPTGQHVSIRAKINNTVVSRSYTPTSNNSDLGRLELVVKVYPDGKLTSYLASLPLQAQVEFAGPKGAMKYHRGLCRSIGMIAGGSGISPMYQVIRAICEDGSDSTTVSLLYANRTEQDILLRKDLDDFARKYPQKFRVHYLLDSPPANWEYTKGYVTKGLIKERLPGAAPDTKVFLCGPLGMIKAATGSLVDLGFTKPGALSKATDQVFLF
jgi:cytochrome-b5 reductase